LRRIPLSRRSHIIGFQPLATGTVEHESALERDFVTLASFLDAGASFTSQPVTLRFRDGQRFRRYTPDYLVRLSAGQVELVEVKYQADLDANQERLRAGFAEARTWAAEHGACFRVVTEREIRGPVLQNAKRLLPLRRAPLDPQMTVRVLTAVSAQPDATFRSVVDSLPQDQAVMLATVWRLIARGALRVDFHAPITYETRITLP
jgi:hypothetical protein